MVTRSIERAQKRVEGHNFDIRKHLLEYDDVMNQQREVIYSRRAHALEGENLKDEFLELIGDFVENKVRLYTDENTYSEDWDWTGLRNDFRQTLLMELPIAEDEISNLNQADLFEKLYDAAVAQYSRREQALGEAVMRQLERRAMLHVIDVRWREHLYEMDQLKEGIGLRAYGQKNPLIEYKAEGFRMFKEMLSLINEQVLDLVLKAPVVEQDPVMARRRMPAQMQTIHDSAEGMGFAGPPQQGAMSQAARQSRGEKQKPVVVGEKVGRNDPCPCGSGKKYKKCHGAVQ